MNTISADEIFFATYCHKNGETHVPNCKGRGCEWYIFGKGCVHSQNPNNKENSNENLR